MSLSKKKWITYLGLLLLPVLLVYSFWRKFQLNDNPRFTITTTIRQIRTLKNGLQIEHYYFVNGEKYVDTYSKDERLNIVYPNGRYIVKFSSKHPGISEVLWKKRVPDSFEKAPLMRWDNPPF